MCCALVRKSTKENRWPLAGLNDNTQEPNKKRSTFFCNHLISMHLREGWVKTGCECGSTSHYSGFDHQGDQAWIPFELFDQNRLKTQGRFPSATNPTPSVRWEGRCLVSRELSRQFQIAWGGCRLTGGCVHGAAIAYDYAITVEAFSQGEERVLYLDHRLQQIFLELGGWRASQEIEKERRSQREIVSMKL